MSVEGSRRGSYASGSTRPRWAADSAVPKPISNNTLGASWTPLGHKPREEGASTTPNSAMRFSGYYSQNTRFKF